VEPFEVRVWKRSRDRRFVPAAIEIGADELLAG
jgi:hypothetical protein